MSRRAEGPPLDPVAEWQDALDEGTFEEAYASLEEVVARLEQGGLPLDTSLAYYELGVRLEQRCTLLLEQAELRISQLDHLGGSTDDTDLWPDNGAGDPFA